VKGWSDLQKAPDAFRTISEVAEELDLPQHVLRFWETRFSQIKPMKRGGGRRYYRPDDISLLRGIRHLLYGEGYTIKGVQRILKDQGVRFVADGAVDHTPDMSLQLEDASNGEPLEATPIEKSVDASPPGNASHDKPAIANLAASYEMPESLASKHSQKEGKAAIAKEGISAPFTLSYNVPAHLVDAITSGPSIVESVPLSLAKGKSGEDGDEPLPPDILPEFATPHDANRARGRGLLERFKSSGMQYADKNLPGNGGLVLATSDAQKLQATLVDLLECKRLLDQIR